mgnify:FL=1
MISTNPIRVSKFSNVRRQLSNEKRRDVATATAKLLGSVMDIGGFEEGKEEDEEKDVPIMFSNATDSDFEYLGLKKSGGEKEDVDSIRVPILLPSPKKKKSREEKMSENLVQRFREFSTTKDVLNVPSRDTIPRIPPIEKQQKRKEKEHPDLIDPRQRLLAYVVVFE